MILYTLSYVDGTVGRVVTRYHNHRSSDGIRSANSDYELSSWLGRLVLDADSASRWMLTFETYQEEHGEPGGLTFATGANAINYHVDRRAPSRRFDRFNLDRKAVSLVWERDFSRGTFSARAWASTTCARRADRAAAVSARCPGAGALTNTIERQQFTTLAPGRVRLDWAIASATPSPPVRSSIAATRRAPTAAAPRPMPPPSVLNKSSAIPLRASPTWKTSFASAR